MTTTKAKVWACNHGEKPANPPDHFRFDRVMMDKWWKHEMEKAANANVLIVLVGEACEVCGRKCEDVKQESGQ